jgi:MYXO-CTERM domain-containing protein
VRIPASIALVLALGQHAAAEVDRCATADTDLAWTGTDLPIEFNGDTGWFPAGYVAQLRLSGRVVGHTAVDAAMQTKACWNGDKMEAQLVGKAAGGWLDAAYGAEISLRGRIHTTVLGQTINWEGNIALPFIPMDLLLEGQGAFDPAVDISKIARVSDATSPITLLSSNVIGDLISVVGISGGLRVTVTPSMATTFKIKKATLAGGTIDSPSDRIELKSSGPRGFGGGFDVPVQADGIVRYEPALRFAARFDVTILGIRVVDWELFAVPMSLPGIERTIKLTADVTRLALPVVEGLGEGARMDFATGTVQELAVRNLGEAPLAIEPTSVPNGALVSRVDIPPGGQDVLKVFVADDATFANGPVEVTLATNDPDRGTIKVQLGKELGGTDPGVEPEIHESGGCSTSGASGPAFLLLGLLALRRRRR